MCQFSAQISGTVLCTSSALFDLIILFAASLETLLQYRWWQLEVLADDRDSSWMWGSEICSIKPNFRNLPNWYTICAHLQCWFDHSACVLTTTRRSTLAAFNLKEDSNPAPSNARAAEESLTASYSQLEHCIHRLAQGTGRADPSNMAELTFRHGDMATAYRDIARTGHTWRDIGIIILIIPNCSHYSPRNNWE